MTEVKSGDTVQIHYTGKLNDGTTFDSSAGREPLQFTVGSGEIIPGLDRALPGMTIGEKKDVAIASEDAYGAHSPDGLQTVPRSDIPAEIPLQVGAPLQAQTPDGQTISFIVREMNDETVTLDANHPLAGQDLNFAIELVAIM